MQDQVASPFEDLFLPHLDAAYNLARYLARDPVAADDISQEAFLRAFRSFASYRGGDARTWLLTIVRHCAFDWLKSRRSGSQETADPEALVDEREGPEASAHRQSEVEALRRRIRLLPEPFRETLILRELEELPYREIAGITGVPVGTVMSRLARARQMLVRDLETVP